jgi:hypothetical protein
VRCPASSASIEGKHQKSCGQTATKTVNKTPAQEKQPTHLKTSRPSRNSNIMSVLAASDPQNKMTGFLDSLVDSSLDTSSKSIKNHLGQIDNEITRVQVRSNRMSGFGHHYFLNTQVD